MHPHCTASERERFSAFVAHLQSIGRKPLTLKAYRCDHVALFGSIAPLGEADLAALTAYDLHLYKRQELSERAAPATVNRRLLFLKSYARWAQDSGRLPEASVRLLTAVPLVQTPALGARAPEPADLQAFLRAVHRAGITSHVALVALLLSGLRASEVCGLRVDDVFLSVTRGSVRLQGPHVKFTAARTVPLAPDARLAVRNHLAKQSGSQLLFEGQRGPLTPNGLGKVIDRYGEAAGVTMHPHLLRHAFSLEYLRRNDGDLAGLQALLGHSRIDTTARYYARKSLDELQKAVDKASF